MGIGALKRAVFLDRDGVINGVTVREGSAYPPQDPADFAILPGVPEACARLRKGGFELVVATNQPDVARGTQTRKAVEAMNAQVRQALPVLDVLTCWHDDPDGCPCRKPKPGLLVEGARRFGLDLGRSFMVGDRWSDIEAGKAAGCAAILVLRDYSKPEKCRPDWTAADLGAAADIILAGGAGK